ncbi:hypothetical protein TSTA_058220 [Talaromyces stipitatus ATCC 10500]|uniref:monoamine oxidase n=1 Tax=Talaromyces stipitatus (strain ATCC 10500 / CBS 375.48 / QM 6759 / NRRL 1006) TaxID=441959 RepID=B8MQD1_TALSN|nr:uncharacterized protein TSTA_058220 [Talaromyces stipitatus ATCC 10500]EED13333.1 hypothetical protein TSTA_058220 [Talaromyces stipitatus ATCC 10500]
MAPLSEGSFWTPTESMTGLGHAKDYDLGTGLETKTVQKSSPVLHDSYGVVVIGAGFTGVIAARELNQRHNLRVLLSEARDHIGGRTWTAKVLGEELEMGGT